MRYAHLARECHVLVAATRDGQLKGRGCVITRGPSVLDLKARPVVCSLRLQREYHFKHFTAQGCRKNARHSPVWKGFSVRIQTSTNVEVKSRVTLWVGHITRAREMSNACKLLVGQRRERERERERDRQTDRQFTRWSVGGRIKLRRILKS